MTTRYSIQRFVLALAVLSSATSQAANWDSQAGISAGLTLTDNVCLDADGEQSEWIAVITPDYSVEMNSRSSQLNMLAGIQINSLSNGDLEDLGCIPRELSRRDQFAPTLKLNGNTVLLDEWLYFDGLLHVDQNRVSAFFAGGDDDDFNRNGNTNTFYRLRFSPYLDHQFGRAAEVKLRYAYDELNNSVDLVRDSLQQRTTFYLGNERLGSQLMWGVEAKYDDVEYSATLNQPASTSILKSARFDLAYQFSRKLQINGYIGEEDNEFISVLPEIDGDFWDAGVTWTPNNRTTIEAGTGERFFGSTPRFSISHELKNSTFLASYVRSLTYDRNIRTADDFFQPGGGTGTSPPVDPATGLPINGTSTDSTISTSPILDDRFRLAWNYAGRLSNVALDLSFSDQTRTEDGRDSTFKRASLYVDRTLSQTTVLDLLVTWDERLPDDDRSDLIVESETLRISLGGRKTVGRTSELSLYYVFTDRDSENAFSSYRENRIQASVRFGF